MEIGRAKYVFVFNNKIQKTVVDTALVSEENNNTQNTQYKNKQKNNDDFYTMLLFGGISLEEVNSEDSVSLIVST